jgi:DNA polymerase-3 subunit epsilon
MSSAQAIYFVLTTTLQRKGCSWKREYFELTPDGKLASVSEYEDKVTLTSIYPRLFLPPGVEVCTRADYRAAKLRHVQALRAALKKERDERAARKLLRGGKLTEQAEHEALAQEVLLTAAEIGLRPAPEPVVAGLLDDITVLDLEFQGTALLEVAARRYKNWEQVDEYVSFVRFEDAIRAQVSDLTGITERDVSQAPLEREVLQLLKLMAGESVLVCHNISADRRVRAASSTRQGATAPLTNQWLCTLAVARLRHPGQPSHKLGDLCRHFKIAAHGAHRALRDVEMCFSLLHHLHQLEPITQLVTSASKKTAKAAAAPTLFAA